MSVRDNFPAQAPEERKQTPPMAVFSYLNFGSIWRCMLGTVFLHSLMEFNQKIYLNIGIISYDFWLSVCLELSVWSCLFGRLTDTLDSKNSIFSFLGPWCLFGAACLTRVEQTLSLLQCVFLHRLMKFQTDTFDTAVLSLFEGVC